jgi:hypothetical protein
VKAAGRSLTKYLQSMAAITGKILHIINFEREVSHPNLIELERIPSESHPDCTNVAIVKAISSKPSKSLIWISARDKRKLIDKSNLLLMYIDSG